jgi:FkbM family methyltransferase
MPLRNFLYRRLARLLTAEIRLEGGARLELDSKFQLASFADTFCRPFYWQALTHLRAAPDMVVDVGAHCGHFCVLADQAISARFGTHHTRYVLMEPNPHLGRAIRGNMASARLESRHKLVAAIAGAGHGPPITMHIHPKNYLSASTIPIPGGKPHSVMRMGLREAVGPGVVDVLKVDIEGAEESLVNEQRELLSDVKLLIMEIHPNHGVDATALLQTLARIGLHPLQPEQIQAGNLLIVLGRL